MAKRKLHILLDDDGSELVEFAIAVYIWIATAFAIMYGSFALYTAHFVSSASDQAARYAMVRGASWKGASCSSTASFDCTATSTDIQNYVKGLAPPGISTSELTTTPNWPGKNANGDNCDTINGTNGQNCVVQVTVSYSFAFPVPFLTKGTLPMTSTSAMTISQ